MKRMAIAAAAVVAANMAVNVAHGQAHERLGVGLAPWQTGFVYGVIVVAPIVAAVLYWTPCKRTGAALLTLSMTGSLAFGVYFHFIAVSNDHVSHLPEGDARSLFVATAVLLVVVEAAGAAFGGWSWVQANAKRKRGKPAV